MIFFPTMFFGQVKSAYLDFLAQSKIVVENGNSLFEISNKEFLKTYDTKTLCFLSKEKAEEQYGMYGNKNMIKIVLKPQPKFKKQELIFINDKKGLKLVCKKAVRKFNLDNIKMLEVFKGKNAEHLFGTQGKRGVKVYTLDSFSS